jgi:DNA replication and repair protein RecF
VQITRLRLFNYRNIKELEIFPSAGTSLFSGQNGQGKTNLLESIYLLGYGKSFRTSTPKECIQHGQSACRIEGVVGHGSLRKDLQIIITNAEKKLFLQGKPVALNEFVGNLHVLAFAHEHLKVVRGAPADRRAFIDRAMIFLYPSHLNDLAVYGRALKQRNAVLSTAHEKKGIVDDNLLDSWDEALTGPGARIISNRLSYVEQMKAALPQELFGSESLKIHYLSTVAAENLSVSKTEEHFRQRLLQARAGDQRTGYTSIGPHRDDVKLFVNGKSLVDFGSAGQQRSSLLALYFSQMEIHRKIHGFYPIFLVDDAEAELDEQRLHAFLNYLSQRTQTFLTSAKAFLMFTISGNACCFDVKNGTVTEHAPGIAATNNATGNPP